MVNNYLEVYFSISLEKQKELVGISTSSFLDNVKKLKQSIS